MTKFEEINTKEIEAVVLNTSLQSFKVTKELKQQGLTDETILFSLFIDKQEYIGELHIWPTGLKEIELTKLGGKKTSRFSKTKHNYIERYILENFDYYLKQREDRAKLTCFEVKESIPLYGSTREYSTFTFKIDSIGYKGVLIIWPSGYQEITITKEGNKRYSTFNQPKLNYIERYILENFDYYFKQREAKQSGGQPNE